MNVYIEVLLMLWHAIDTSQKDLENSFGFNIVYILFLAVQELKKNLPDKVFTPHESHHD